MTEKNTGGKIFQKDIPSQEPSNSELNRYALPDHGWKVPMRRKALAESFLGKIVRISIDRPIGSTHPKYKGLIYPINYGFIPNVWSEDCEELDVYLLGVNKPKKEFIGKIIGIVHRKDDVEDKLVMAPKSMKFTQNEIAEQVYFQERYYEIEIEAMDQKSCGAVIFKKENGNVNILCLFQQHSQTYSVPKGHMEAFETEEETAKREIKEETGLSVNFVPGFRETIAYALPGGKQKTVVLFLAECTEQPKIEIGEISSDRWLSMQEAIATLPEWYHSVLEKAEKALIHFVSEQ